MQFWTLLVTVSVMWITAAVAQERRVALVVGNAEYSSVVPLDNARNDARLITESLKAVGFEVTLVENGSQTEMKRAIAQFGRELRGAGPDTVGLFYYAGHGVQSFGSNYLLPVDASLTDAADLDLVALEAASVLRQMASARNKTNIVILDACRNNPFEDIPDMNDNGLAEMKAPTGTYLAFATAPGTVALDGTGTNSPFTSALAEAMKTEGASIEEVFKKVRVEVLDQTRGAQTPWDTSSMTQDFVFKPGKVLSPEEVAEMQLWDSVKATSDPVQIMLFLRAYPRGLFEDDARGMLARVLEEELDRDKPEPEVVAEPEPEAAPAPPPDLEVQLMETARASGQIEDYQAYLEAFPSGIFAELVKIEIAGLEAKAAAAAEEQVAAVAPEPEPEPEPVPVVPSRPLAVFFDQPLQEGAPEIVGKTIMEVAGGSPIFPPIEGLPESLWKDQQCTNCHLWTRDDLCNQGNTYLAESAARALDKQHPFGGSFKRNLRTWAEGGCQ